MKRWSDQPIVSTSLVAVNVLVYILCAVTGDFLYSRGRLDAFSVLAGQEYDRIIWAMFLHSGMNHLFNNMLILYFLSFDSF